MRAMFLYLLLSGLVVAGEATVDFQMCVAREEHDDVIEMLKRSRAIIEEVNLTSLSIKSVRMLEVLDKSGYGERVLSDCDVNGMNLWLIAAQNGQLDILRYLGRKGAEVNYKDDYGRTALYYSGGNTNSECVKFLIERGAYVDCQNSVGVSPLIFAIQEGAVSSVELLLSVGAQTNLKDSAGKSALDYAMMEPSVGYVPYSAHIKIKEMLVANAEAKRLKVKVNPTGQPKHGEDQR